MIKLPVWQDLLANFPDKDAEAVFTEIGGKVKLNYDIGVFSNACATRISKALNYSGEEHLIPYYTIKDKSGKKKTQVSSGQYSPGKQDADEPKKWYIFRLKILIKYLTEKYGEPEQSFSAEYKDRLNGRKGIIIFTVSKWKDATGHSDLWNGEECVRTDFGDEADNILFWEAS
jgi:hypothetical protein